MPHTSIRKPGVSALRGTAPFAGDASREETPFYETTGKEENAKEEKETNSTLRSVKF